MLQNLGRIWNLQLPFFWPFACRSPPGLGPNLACIQIFWREETGPCCMEATWKERNGIWWIWQVLKENNWGTGTRSTRQNLSTKHWYPSNWSKFTLLHKRRVYYQVRTPYKVKQTAFWHYFDVKPFVSSTKSWNTWRIFKFKLHGSKTLLVMITFKK